MSTFIDTGSVYMAIPEGYTGTLDAVVYYPSYAAGFNLGNSGSETLPLEQYAAANPDKIIIINKDSHYNAEGVFEALAQVEQSEGIDVGVVDIFTHSKSDTAGVLTANAAHDYGFQVAHTTSLDSNGQLSRFNPRRDGEDTQGNGIIQALSHEDINNFAKSGSMLVTFEQGQWGKTQLAEFINELEPGNEVPLMYITCNVGGSDFNNKHYSMVVEPLDNGLVDLYSGKVLSLGLEPTSYRGSHIKGYQFEMYDYKTNNWVQYTKEEAEKILASYGRNLSDYIGSSTLPSYQVPDPRLVSLSVESIQFDVSAAVANLGSGSNAIVYKDELLSFLGSSALASLTTDITDATSLSGLIEQFRSNGVLKGDLWNLSYTKLGIYDDALKERIALAGELGDAIKSAIQKLLACMEDYGMLDTSKIPEVTATLEQLKNSRNTLEALIRAGAYNENGERDYAKEQAWAEELASLNEQIAEAEKLLKALVKLQQTYDEVVGELDAIIAKIQSFGNSVSEIAASEKYSYSI